MKKIRLLTVVDDNGFARILLLKAARTILWHAIAVIDGVNKHLPEHQRTDGIELRERLKRYVTAYTPQPKLKIQSQDQQLPRGDRVAV